ncbi:MAG: MFS transporter [Polyangiales bacterium]
MLAVAFLDELASGVAPASAPDIARFLGVSGGVAAGAIIVAFHSLAFFLETPLLAWSERISARWFSTASLGAIAFASFLAAAFPGGVMLFVALAVYGPASGCALAIAEGLLVEANPHERERTMARVTLAASTGDLAVPLLLAFLAWLGLGFRAGFAVGGAVALVLAVAHASARSLDRLPAFDTDDDEEEEGSDDAARERASIRETLRQGLANRPLLAWSIANVLTALLDEVLVAFSAVHLDAIGATASQRSWTIAAWVVGGFVGLITLERTIARLDPRRVLMATCVATTVAMAIFAGTSSPWVATAALFAVGAFSATIHPLAKARAYAAMPGRPSLVNALSSLLLPLDMIAPVALAAIAAYGGSRAAIIALVGAPVGVAMIGWRMRSKAAGRGR